MSKMVRYYGQENVPGAPGQAPNAGVRFDPSQLYFQPGPGYFQNPNYSPFRQDQDRDRFILHDPRSGVAGGNPLLDPRFKIQGGEPWNKTPILPGKETKDFENQPIPRPMLPGGQAGLLAQGLPPMGNAGAGFAPSLQNPVVIPEGFQQQLDQMEEETRKQQFQRFITPSPASYPQRYF